MLRIEWAPVFPDSGRNSPVKNGDAFERLALLPPWQIGCRAILVTKGPWSGLNSTEVYIYKGALLPVELSLKHCHRCKGAEASGGTFTEPPPVGLLP